VAERHLCSAKDEVIKKFMLLASRYDQSLIRCKVCWIIVSSAHQGAWTLGTGILARYFISKEPPAVATSPEDLG
jgi:hypothetical protein